MDAMTQKPSQRNIHNIKNPMQMTLINSFHNTDLPLQMQGDINPKDPVNHNPCDLNTMW